VGVETRGAEPDPAVHAEAHTLAGSRPGDGRDGEETAMVELEFEPHAVLEWDRAHDQCEERPLRIQGDVSGPREERLIAFGQRAVETEEPCDRLGGGVFEQLARRPGGRDPTVEQYKQAVREGPRLGAVVDDYDRGVRSRAQRALSVAEQLGARDRVEPGERLVEQQDVGPDSERTREMNAAALAAGQRRRRAVGQVIDAKFGKRRACPGCPLAAWHAPPGERQLDVLRNAPTREVGGLQRDGDTPAALHASPRGREHPGESIEQGALPSAVRAEQHEHLSRSQLEIHVADDIAAIALHAER
jgi:hypothetical protein